MEGDWLALDHDELEALCERVRSQQLDPGDYPLLLGIITGYSRVTGALREKEISVSRLRALMFGASTEKTSTILKDTPGPDGASGTTSEKTKKKHSGKRKGHGRNGADKYTGATRTSLVNEALKHGDLCPHCAKGRVYKEKDPRVFIWITGKPPLAAERYERESLRCNLCQDTFVAPLPENVDAEGKYDESATAMLGLIKYATGMPFYRLEKLQESLGIPLPASTQWDLVAVAADRITPVFQELMRYAAQGRLLYNDDTTMKLLTAPEANRCERSEGTANGAEDDLSQRTGTFTSAIISEVDDRKVAIYRTGWRHAGENLAELLKERAEGLPTPQQMCDALSRNAPKGFKTVLSNCLAHARRRFAEVASCWPQECRFVLETLRDVYANDERAAEKHLSPEERLSFHQDHSGPLMEKLKRYIEDLLAGKSVEPNSSFGRAIKYMLRHWEPLTLFLREVGAKLDNNICERALKLAILHRKNALFFRTMNGAAVGDLFMSLIHTCRFAAVNPFDYLTALLRNVPQAFAHPAAWMPWNYPRPVP